MHRIEGPLRGVKPFRASCSKVGPASREAKGCSIVEVRKWPYVLLAVLPPLAFLTAVFVDFARDIAQAGSTVGKALAKSLVDSVDVVRVEPKQQPDLVVALDEPGYLTRMAFGGSQLHYYSKYTDTTTVAGEMKLGDEVMRIPLARYRGRPWRDVKREELTPIERWFSLLMVQGIDGNGNPSARIDVRVKLLRQTAFTGDGTRVSGLGAGEVWFLLGPGTCA